MTKYFLYCESTEGGMDSHTAHGTDDSIIEHFRHSLRAWMTTYCREDDEALIEFIQTAEVGDYFDHRLGICVRISSPKEDEV